MVTAPVAKTGDPGFESPATTKICSHFSLAIFKTPLSEKVSQSNLINKSKKVGCVMMTFRNEGVNEF